jgi:uncharacterized protein YndB with AHSA1/START domain
MTIAATGAILIEARLDEPPALVWRALTEPELMARWLGEGDVEAVVGRRFVVRPGGAAGQAPVDCEVVEAEPERLLSYRWRADGEGTAALDTVVTWILEPTAEGGTRLRLVHDGFPIVVEQEGRTRESAAAATLSARSREGGNPGFFASGTADHRKNLDPRLRGDERLKLAGRRLCATTAPSQRSLKWAA